MGDNSMVDATALKTPAMTDLREQIARALMVDAGFNPDAFIRASGGLGHFGDTAKTILSLPAIALSAPAPIDGPRIPKVPPEAIEAQLQALEAKAAETLWTGAPLVKGLAAYVRAMLTAAEKEGG